MLRIYFSQRKNNFKMETMLSNVTDMWEDMWERRDKRMDEYPLMGNPLHTAVICCIYVYLIAIAGPKYMKDRKPMNIRSFLIVYNASMVVLSLYMFVQVSGNILRNTFYDQKLQSALLIITILRSLLGASWWFVEWLQFFLPACWFLRELQGKDYDARFLRFFHIEIHRNDWLGKLS